MVEHADAQRGPGLPSTASTEAILPATHRSRRGPLDGDDEGEVSLSSVPGRPILPFFRNVAQYRQAQFRHREWTMDPQAVASFYATNLPSHMNAYCSSSDSENETEKMQICGASRARECRTFSRYPGGSSMHSPVFGGSVLMVEAMEGSSPGMPEEPLEGRQRQPGHHSPMAADISSQQALPMMGTQARTTQHTPALHFRGDSGEFPAPESHPCTEKERMSDFPPPSFYRTDSIGNLVSDPQVAPISLPDRPITPIFYTDPAGNVMTDPPTPGTRKHGKSATLSEKNASRSSELDEVNASANWQLYNNMMCDITPDAPPVPPEENSSSSFRIKECQCSQFFGVESPFFGRLACHNP